MRTLPERRIVHDWTLVWVGFDVLFELPLAALLLWVAVTVIRQATRNAAGDQHVTLRNAPISRRPAGERKP